MENAIHWINPNPVDNVMGFRNTYPQLDSNLSGGEHYPAFNQLGPVGKPLNSFTKDAFSRYLEGLLLTPTSLNKEIPICRS